MTRALAPSIGAFNAFFAAHFFQDPVWPGSLGLEAFMQMLKLIVVERFGVEDIGFQTLTPRTQHHWTYRGQVIPSDQQVTVQAVVTHVDEAARTVTADGFLLVDGRVIYEMKDFSLGWQAR